MAHKKHEHDREHEACHCHDHDHDHDHDHEPCHGHGHDHDADHDGCDCGCSCGCDHDHEDEDEEKGVGLTLLRYGLGGLPVLVGFLSFLPTPVRLIAAALGYLLFGLAVWRGMLRGFKRGKLFTEFTLMCAATLCAFAIGEYADGAAVMYLYSLGETLSGGAYARSRKNLSELLAISPEYASVLREEGFRRVSPEEVAVGDTILVLPGERIPLDGVVTEGGGYADASSVTGEAKPLELYPGVACPSGAILQDGSLRLSVTADYQNSVVTRLSDAVRDASARKSATERRIAKFAGVFTPIAFGVAALVFLLGFAVSGQWIPWLRAAAVVLVVSCPCSLVLSVPLTYFAGMGLGAKRGMIFRGGEVMDGLGRVGAVCFDKTGTLTRSELSFDGAEVYGGMSEEEFLSLAADVLAYSPHAAAVSFCGIFQSDGSRSVESVENIGGRGVVCLWEGQRVCFGNAALMREHGIELSDSKNTAIFGCKNGILLGKLNFSAHLKEGSRRIAAELAGLGVERIAVLSGDGETAVAESCAAAGIDEFYSDMKPDEKVSRFAVICREQRSNKKRPLSAYCGDGLNDSAVLAGADVGIAMGRAGSALTVSAADLCLMDDDPAGVAEAIRLSRRTAAIATQNIVLSLGIKLAVLLGGVLVAMTVGGGLSMELAIVADVGAALLAVLNALRAAKTKK